MPDQRVSKVDRNEIGLSLVERRLIQEIAILGSWEKAADSLGMTRRQVRALFKKEPFKLAYDELFDAEDLETTKRELTLAASDVASIYEEAKNAEMTKRVQATCPKCTHKFDVLVTVANWATRLKAGDTLLKITGLLQDRKNVKVEGTVGVVNVHLSAEEMLALQRLKMGLDVPEHIYRRLEETSRAGRFDLPARPTQVVEGEFRAVQEETT